MIGIAPAKIGSSKGYVDHTQYDPPFHYARVHYERCVQVLHELFSASSGAVSANQSDWQRARLACADVGAEPSEPAFGQCVVDLYYSLWDQENEPER